MLIKIRNAKPEDVDLFVKLYIKAYRGLECYAYISKRDIKNYFKWLMKRDCEGVFTAEAGFCEGVTTVAGFAACDTNWFSRYESKVVGEIHEIFVKPEFRGKGIGKALMTRSIDYAAKKGRDVVELWVGDRNYGAIEFYKKMGFKSSGKSGCWIRMVKNLKIAVKKL